jgi:hypothetical protein
MSAKADMLRKSCDRQLCTVLQKAQPFLVLCIDSATLVLQCVHNPSKSVAFKKQHVWATSAGHIFILSPW